MILRLISVTDGVPHVPASVGPRAGRPSPLPVERASIDERSAERKGVIPNDLRQVGWHGLAKRPQAVHS